MPPYKDVPASRLVTVQPGVQLLDIVASLFLAARNAYAEEEHRNLTIALPAGGYRSHAMDVDMHAHPSKYNITPGIGLLPIDYSVHRTGRCVDIANGRDWMIINGHRWGFKRPLKFDPNHFENDGITLAGGNAEPFTEDEDEMKILNLGATEGDGSKRLANVYFFGPGGIKHIADPNDKALLERFIADAPGDIMYTSQIAVVNSYLLPPAPTIDIAGIRSAVLAAVADVVKADGDAAAIAKAVDQVLADNFAALPAATAAALGNAILK